MDTIFPLFTALLLGLGGILCFATALRWRSIQRGFRPDNVLRVYGTLTRSQTHKNYRAPRLMINTPTDLHEFTYSYTVDGTAYTVTDRLLRSDTRIPSGAEIICQRSDPRHCYIPGLTKPPAEDDHHVLYWIGALSFAAMLAFLGVVP